MVLGAFWNFFRTLAGLPYLSVWKQHLDTPEPSGMDVLRLQKNLVPSSPLQEGQRGQAASLTSAPLQ